MKQKKLAQNEIQLATVLAPWLLNEMEMRLVDEQVEPGMLYDCCQSNFELCCSALAAAKVLHLEGVYWRIWLKPNEKFNLPEGYTRADFDLLLDAYACHVDFCGGQGDFTEKRYVEGANGQVIRAAYVFCGFTTRHEGRWAWTDAFLPWLVKNGLVSLSDVAPVSHEILLAEKKRIPGEVLKRVAGREAKLQKSFVTYLFSQKRGDGWKLDHSWNNTPSACWDMKLAAAMYAELH